MSFVAYITGSLTDKRTDSDILEISPIELRAIDSHLSAFCERHGFHIDLYESDTIPLEHLPALNATLLGASIEIAKCPSLIEIDCGLVVQPDGSYSPNVGIVGREDVLNKIAKLLHLVSAAIARESAVSFDGD